MSMTSSTKRVSRITGKAMNRVVGPLSDIGASLLGADKSMSDAASSHNQSMTVQRNRARRQLQEEYTRKEAAMPPSQSQTMAQTMEKTRKHGVSSSGMGVGY